MDPGVAIALGFLWFLFNVFGKKKSGNTGPRPPGQRPPAPRPTRVPPPARLDLDPTQREGARLQDVLRQLGGVLETSTAEARSLEEDISRPQRVEVDKDDEAEAVIARRRAAAEANALPLGKAEHTAFDARIRQEPADATGTRETSIRRLRQAVVWREILGPPVSLRHPDDL